MDFNDIPHSHLIRSSNLTLENQAKILIYISNLQEKLKNINEEESKLKLREQELEQKLDLFEKEKRAYSYYVDTLEKITKINILDNCFPVTKVTLENE